MNGERFIELRKDEHCPSFGFNIKGGYDTGCPVYVWRVEPGSLADRYGLKSGDEILQANGIDFTRIEHAEALKLLKGQHTLCLYLRSHPSQPQGAQHPTQPTLDYPLNASLDDEDIIYSNAEFYTWVDRYGAPVSPPKLNDSWPKRSLEIEIQPGQNLGLMIRGGAEYGLGIYVTGVDPGSVAERAGLQRGDEILDVNGRSFTSITHDKAVQILKSSRKMAILASYIGKIPADLTFEPQVKLIEDDINKCTNILAMIEEKAMTVLTKSEHSRFTFYREEYQQGFLPVHTFVRILLELLSTHEKYTLLTEVREIIRPADRTIFDELIYKPIPPSGYIQSHLEEPGLHVERDRSPVAMSATSNGSNGQNSDLVFLREFNNAKPDPMCRSPVAGSNSSAYVQDGAGQLNYVSFTFLNDFSI
ncbi:unnamed protein product [Allacma fusca]|uniref:PDZ domain-containing protein n=1 Tax=Allacma fusca TaxID=39272 RepID=A0A8J2LMF6_9HEXA|nr:unnamed protein product [Allacma fusca]